MARASSTVVGREALVVPAPGELPQEDAAEERGHGLAGQQAPPAIRRQRDRDQGDVAERVQRVRGVEGDPVEAGCGDRRGERRRQEDVHLRPGIRPALGRGPIHHGSTAAIKKMKTALQASPGARLPDR